MSRLLRGRTLLVLDTETTGMSPDAGDRLVEVAYVPIVDGAIGEGWSSLVRPGRPIPPGAERVHGIHDAMVRDAPGYAEVGRALRESCADLPLVFHNYPFDLPFLVALFREAGAPMLVNPIIDTLGMARGLGSQGSNSLGPLAGRLGVTPGTLHRALTDARTTAEVFLKLAERWEAARPRRALAELAADSQDILRASARR